ncbi:hypothetical protein CJI59_13235 [Streptomyces sp. Alain-F2R5]|uniref:hypothetical protein n=1 Tax=Streptomyces mutabilis TaxID=67332 RepID=UPI000A233AE8|nr:hypothetical protein [Streptomyces sp. Alain-F2R5]OSC62698.1 hypothetical protein B5181_23995 [Streptomyces sp. 4F]PAN01117.1 hypothetical protein CJI59_13235 [Streptomyces sp. Alain-F2R5]
MSRAAIGMLAGMALAFAGWFGGFGAFLLVAALGAVGGVAGRLADNGTDWREFLAPGDRRTR